MMANMELCIGILTERLADETLKARVALGALRRDLRQRKYRRAADVC